MEISSGQCVCPTLITQSAQQPSVMNLNRKRIDCRHYLRFQQGQHAPLSLVTCTSATITSHQSVSQYSTSQVCSTITCASRDRYTALSRDHTQKMSQQPFGLLAVQLLGGRSAPLQRDIAQVLHRDHLIDSLY